MGTQHAICMVGDDATRMVRLVGHAMGLQLHAGCCSRQASPHKLSKPAEQISPTPNGQGHWEPPSMPMSSPGRGNDMAARADETRNRAFWFLPLAVLNRLNPPIASPG